MATQTPPVLDRRELFDPRSRAFPLTAVIPTPLPRSYTHSVPIQLNQNIGCYHCRHMGGCVGHAIKHALAARPIGRLPLDKRREPWDLYHQAQRFDPPEWNTPPEEGTAVLAGLKVAKDQGLIGGFAWGFTLKDWILGVGARGAVVGTVWMSGMWEVDAKGFVHATGIDEGGHCYYLYGQQLVWKYGTTTEQKRSADWFSHLDLERSYFKIWNSWGAIWAMNGTAKISFAEADVLRRNDGELATLTRSPLQGYGEAPFGLAPFGS